MIVTYSESKVATWKCLIYIDGVSLLIINGKLFTFYGSVAVSLLFMEKKFSRKLK